MKILIDGKKEKHYDSNKNKIIIGLTDLEAKWSFHASNDYYNFLIDIYMSCVGGLYDIG